MLSKTYKILSLFVFSNLNKNHELFTNKNKKIIGKFKIETPKNIFTDEVFCLRSKAYSIKCGSDNKNKLRGISKCQSKNITPIDNSIFYYNFASAS